jgi:hypothetical protein
MLNNWLRAAFVFVCLAVTSPIVIAQQSKVALGDVSAEPRGFYRADEVQAVYLTVTGEDRRRMLDALPERIYVPAAFRWNGISLKKVAIRFKGNSSSSPRQMHKRSYLIKFDKYDKSQRFLGLQRASLDNGVQFGSLFSEPIVTEILRAEGLAAQRCNYAKLYLNDEYQGVYVNVERIDETFLQSRFGDPDAALFKADIGGPGGNLQFIGDDPAAYARAFEPKTKAAKLQGDRLVEFIKMINQTPKEEFAAKLEASFDVDRFLRVSAIMLYSGAFDQLTGWNPHNFYLYRATQSDRWHYLPWDLDVGFCEVAFGKIHVLEDWNAAWPLPGGRPNPLLDRIVDDPELLARYRLIAREILDKHFQPEPLSRRFDAKYALIREALESDPFPHQRVTNPTDREYDDIIKSQKEFVRKRYANANEQLSNPGGRPKFARRQEDRGQQPAPGTGLKQAPTELNVLETTRTHVVLQWKDNADGEAGHIIQRASGAAGGEFQNLMGMPGDHSTKAKVPRDPPGQTFRYRVYALHPTPGGPTGTAVSNVVTVNGDE